MTLSVKSRSRSGSSAAVSNSDETRLLIEDAAAAASSTASAEEAETLVEVPPDVGGGGRSGDFVFIKIVARIVLRLITKFWAVSSASLIAIIFLWWLCGGIFAFGLVLFSLSGLLYHAMDRLLYHPDQPSTARVFVPAPSAVGLPFESFYIKSRDGTRLHLFLVKRSDPGDFMRAPTILFFHGNAGNIGHRLPNVKSLVVQLGCNVCLLEYRGYGHSDGAPSEEGLYLDAQASLDHLMTRRDLDTSKILVFGRSLGGAVAIDLCSRVENRDKVKALIVENSFTSIPDVAQVLFNFRVVKMIPRCFYKNRYDSQRKARKLSVPTLFLSGSADMLVPPAMMKELFNICSSEQKHLANFPGGNHNETWTCHHYLATVLYFLEEIVQLNGPTRTRLSPPPTLVSGQQVV